MKIKKQLEQKDNNTKNTRREFLKKGVLAGVGTILAGGIVTSFNATASGKTVNVLGPDGKVKTVAKEHLKDIGKKTEAQLQKAGREGIPNRRWVMVIDLGKCKNDQRCMEACQTHHQLWTSKDGKGDKVQHHINVHELKRNEKSGGFFMPKTCQHCDNPPCTKVCPVDATYKRDDGIVLIDNLRCIGCRFCVAACPYSARVFNWHNPKDEEKYADKKYNVELNVPQKRGTVTKCVFSADRLREGELPYCVSACGNGVFWFGDENEDAVTNGTTKETVRLSKLLKDNAAYTLMPELATRPRVYYLPEKDRIFPFESKKKEGDVNHHA